MKAPLELKVLQWAYIYFLGCAFCLDPFLQFCVRAQMAARWCLSATLTYASARHGMDFST